MRRNLQCRRNVARLSGRVLCLNKGRCIVSASSSGASRTYIIGLKLDR